MINFTDYLQRRIQKNNKQYLLLSSQHLLSEFKFSRSHLEEPQGTVRPLCWLALLLSLFVCVFSDVETCAIYWRQRTATYLVSNSFSFQVSSSLCSQIKKGASFTDPCKSFTRFQLGFETQKRSRNILMVFFCQNTLDTQTLYLVILCPNPFICALSLLALFLLYVQHLKYSLPTVLSVLTRW